MKQKILIIVAGVAVLVGTGLYVFKQPRTTALAPATLSPELETDTTALEAAVRARVELKAKLQAYKAQLAIYEKILQHAPDNAEAQRRVDTLRTEIKVLENQNAPR